MSKLKKICFTTIFIAVFLILLPIVVKAKSYSIEQMDIDATIQPNGDLKVEQSITYDFDGSYNGIYLTIPYEIYDVEKNEVIKNGSALNKFRELIIAQGGDPQVLNNYSLFKIGNNKVEIKALETGYISKICALDVAHSAKLLGAGRDKKTDDINYGAGIILKKKVSNPVNKGETVMELYYDDIEKEKLNEAVTIARNSFKISKIKVEKPQLIF